MKPPAKVKVGGYVYDIHVGGDRYDAHAHELATGSDGGILFGYTSRVNAYIVINPLLPVQIQRTTLVHEVMHAVWGLNDDPPKLTEEFAIQRLADGFTQVLRDNPKLTEYLLEK